MPDQLIPAGPLPARHWLLPSAGPGLKDSVQKMRLEKIRVSLGRIKNALAGKSFPAYSAASISNASDLLQKSGIQNKSPAVMHPTFYLWTAFAEALIKRAPTSRDPAWSVLFSHLQTFALSHALWLKRPFEAAVLCDQRGHVHWGGLGWFLDLGSVYAFRPLLIKTGKNHLAFASPSGDLKMELPIKKLLSAGHENDCISRTPLLAEKIEMDACHGLIWDKVSEHGINQAGKTEALRFCQTLQAALRQISRADKALFHELTTTVQLVVPLKTPKGLTSVSSTYKELPGTILLSHCEDPLVQAETLIHESCHGKLNALTNSESLFIEESGAAYYSPLKDYPRPLYYILFAAHAFINVSGFLISCLEQADSALSARKRSEIELYVCRRLFEVELELETLSRHARLTRLGRDFLLESRRELGILFERTSSFRHANILQAKKIVEAHRGRFTRYPSLLFRKTENEKRKTRGADGVSRFTFHVSR